MSTDPWLEAANNLQTRLTSEYTTRQQARDAAEVRKQQEYLAWQRKDASRRAVILTEAAKLTALLNTRGVGARKLVEVVNSRPIVFGDEVDGGTFTSVVFTKDGLEYVSGYITGYDNDAVSRTPATVIQAIEYAVIYGGRDPQKVTDWFVDTLNRLAKLATI